MARTPCCEKAHTNKGAWSKEEDQRLTNHIRAHGEGCWRSLPKAAGLLRCGKSCRLRWINYLRPDLKRGNFSDEEDELIIRLHSLLGNKWSLIAGRLPGRTDNEIKNYWNTHIKRKLLSRGLDPQTHHSLNAASTSSSSPLITPVPEISVMTKIIDYNNMISNADIKIITHSAEEAKSISGMTEEEEEEEEEEEGREEEYPEPEINLDLSLGLQFQKPSANTGESNKSICLCRHLGFQRSQACNCKTMATKITTNGFHSYYRQLDS